MRQTFLARCGLLPFLVCFAATSCTTGGESAWSGVHVNAHAGAFLADLDGSVKTTNGGLSGTFDTGDIGQDSASLSGVFGVRAGWQPFEIALSGFEYAETGTGTYTGSFLGTGFTGNVRSDFQISNLKGTFGWDFVNTEQVRVGVLAGVDFLSVDLQLDDVGGLASERVDESLPVPVLGLRGDVGLIEDLRLGGELVGLSVTVSDFDVTFYDLDLGLHYQVYEHVEAFLGYRLIHLDFEGPIGGGSNVDIGLDVSGPFFGVGISF